MSPWWSKRPKPSSPAAARGAVDSFWSWWEQEGADAAARAISDGEARRLVPLIAPRVEAVHRGLAWELAPGPAGSEHVLVVSAEGDPLLRGLARRWLLGAPPPDRTWAYSDSRLPDPDDSWGLEVEDHWFSSDDVAVAWDLDDERDCLDVALHHPALVHLSEQGRQLVTVVALDRALGEHAVETWVGGIEISTDPLPASGGLLQLRAAAADLAASRLDDDGTPAWKMVEGTAPDGSAVLAMHRVPLRSASAPHLEQHVAVTLPYRRVTDAGLPDEPSLLALRAFADAAEEACGPHALLVAHESCAGERVLHVYADPLSDAEARLREHSATWSEGTPRVRSTRDPGWEQVAHLRG